MPYVFASAVAALLFACSSSGAAITSCGVPGVSQSCVCSSGSGTQTCLVSGAWDVCVCDPGGNATAGSGSSGGTAGTSIGQAGNSGAGNGGSAGTLGPNPMLDGGGMQASDAGDASMSADASQPAQSYGACSGDGDCIQGQTCFQSPFGGFPGSGGQGSGGGFCTTTCVTGNDCPAPPSPSTAQPACSSSGTCLLVCSAVPDGCPTGLVCQGGICF